MAITRKPTGAAHLPSLPVDVEDLINRGGSSPAAAAARSVLPPTAPAEPEDKVVPVILRLPSSMLRSIDALVRNRPVRIPRHTWLLEAVHEKLSREAETTSSDTE